MKHFLLLIGFLSTYYVGFTQVLPSFGNSRTGSAGMQFLKINPDARGNALGGSYIAQADDAASMFWNPAGITRVSEKPVHLAINNTLYFGGFNIASASAVYRPGKQTYWGAYLYSMNSPEMEETTEFQPFGTGRTFRAAHQIAGITYARVLTNNFSFGVNGKFARESYGTVAINNVLFDVGLHYLVGVKNARFAITLSNFGLNVQPNGEVKILKYTGAQYVSNFERVSVPSIFRIGAAFDPIDRENHRLTVSAQLNHPTDNNETLAFGFEYLVRKTLYFRTGYEFGLDVASLPPIGTGIRLPRRFGVLHFDYTIQHQSGLGNIQRFGLSCTLK